jgi:serine phosphatase RsbU (regulator of sigma subunit)
MDLTNDKKLSDELDDELRNFHEIARYLKPSSGNVPKIDGIDIAGRSLPLRKVIGGDHIIYIDFNRRYKLDRRIERAKRREREEVATKLTELKSRAGILLADVSGHRMTDALLAAMLHQSFLVGAYYELDRYGEITTRLFENINSRFYRTTAVSKYFTMIYGEITVGGKFRFISAGHQPPAIFSREFSSFVSLDTKGLTSFPPVGLLPSSVGVDDDVDETFRGKKRYEVNQLNLLSRGDLLLLMTDGLAEHGDGDFMKEVIEGVLREMIDEPAETIVTRIEAEIPLYATPNDDISFVVVKRTV